MFVGQLCLAGAKKYCEKTYKIKIYEAIIQQVKFNKFSKTFFFYIVCITCLMYFVELQSLITLEVSQTLTNTSSKFK